MQGGRGDVPYWNPRMETMPREERQAVQVFKLKRLLSWARERSPFWRQRLAEAGVDPAAVRSVDDIRRLPFLTRAEFTRCQAESPLYGDLLAVPREEVVRHHQTSGSSGGTPLRIADTWKDWEWVSEMWCYGMYAFGVRETDVVYVVSAYGTFIGFWGAHYAAEKIGAVTIPGGGLGTVDRLRRLLELEVTVFVATPTYALRLAQVAREQGIDLARESAVRLLIHAGEPGANIPATKRALEEAWGAKAGDFPGMSETGGSTAFECAEQCGGVHILEDHYIQEVIDPRTLEPVGYGEQGELVLTSFGRTAMPLIRYRTGDLVERVPYQTCSCGRTYDLYRGGIIGRADDMKVIRGVNVFPSAVEDIIRRHPVINEFQVVIDREREMDRITVRLEPAVGTDPAAVSEASREIARELAYAHQGLRFEVETVERGVLPRYELKARRVVDRR